VIFRRTRGFAATLRHFAVAAVPALCCLTIAHAQVQSADAGKACREATGQPEETIAACSRFIGTVGVPDVELAVAHNRRGLAYFRQHEFARAADDLDLAISLNPQYAVAFNSRAILYQEQGDIERALADYDAAIRLSPKYAFALANRGGARLSNGDADAAIADFDAALALNVPKAEMVITGRGKAYLGKGDFARAVAEFDAALKLNPKHANALSGRAWTHFGEGRFDAAAEDFARERQIRADADSALALFLAQARGGHEAKAALAAATKVADPQQGLPPGVALFLGQVTAEQVLQAVTDKNPKTQRDRTCTANFQVGEWHLLENRPELARTHLSKATQLCNKSLPEFAAARAELARLK
jgi:tetratricopeptide (TPR) repeat protein